MEKSGIERKTKIPESVNRIARDFNGQLWGYDGPIYNAGGVWMPMTYHADKCHRIHDTENEFDFIKNDDKEPHMLMAFKPTVKKETDIEMHRRIAEEVTEMFIKKNSDYGNSFSKTFAELGMISAVSRIADKTNRLISLTRSNEPMKVDGESVADTLKDLIGYGIMSLMELERTGAEQTEPVEEL